MDLAALATDKSSVMDRRNGCEGAISGIK